MAGTFFVATRKGLFRARRGRDGWQLEPPAFLGDPVSAVLPLKDGSVLAALDLGHFGVKLHVSTDGGRTFRETGCPAFPVQTAAEKEAEAARTMPAPWQVQKIWTLEESVDGTLWAGAIPAGLFRSGDGGATWELVRALWDRPERGEWMGGGYDHAGIHSIAPDPRDASALLVGISSGGVWRTPDAGATWSPAAKGMRAAYMPPERAFDENVQDPHRVARCAAQPDVLWVQHHNGIFRTGDGARGWTEIEKAGPSTFGFAVAAHPSEPGTAWFVPAVKDEKRVPVDGRLVVTRTRDGGATFDVLGNGLPARDAYDLVYRHGLDVDASGRTLAFGSTTGSLFVSEDAGDSWTLMSAHLPPVYAVRFA
jgi:hypothetical protein